MTAPMDLTDDDLAAVEFFKRNAVSTTKGGVEINVSATVLQMAQKLSDARAALRTARKHVRHIYCDRSEEELSRAGKGSRTSDCWNALNVIDFALAGTPESVAVPVDDTRRCAICAWPLAKDGLVSQGCVRGNCSFRGEPPIRPEQRYAPARAEIEACAGCAKVARHPDENYTCLMHPRGPVRCAP
jgi:hypothetical protein